MAAAGPDSTRAHRRGACPAAPAPSLTPTEERRSGPPSGSAQNAARELAHGRRAFRARVAAAAPRAPQAVRAGRRQPFDGDTRPALPSDRARFRGHPRCARFRVSHAPGRNYAASCERLGSRPGKDQRDNRGIRRRHPHSDQPGGFCEWPRATRIVAPRAPFDSVRRLRRGSTRSTGVRARSSEAPRDTDLLVASNARCGTDGAARIVPRLYRPVRAALRPRQPRPIRPDLRTGGSMTPTELFATAARLHDNGTEYALVSVVRAEAPTSARPGDKALVTGDGAIHGWIGGGCAQPAVIKTVRLALADGKARMIRIAPDAGSEREQGDVAEGIVARRRRRPCSRGSNRRTRGLPDRRFDTGGGRAVGAGRRGRAAPRDTPVGRAAGAGELLPLSSREGAARHRRGGRGSQRQLVLRSLTWAAAS